MFAETERPTSFIFYDLETTGLHRDFDQIIQIAMVKTDADFNIVDEVTDIRNIRCRRLPWVVPDPAALLLTRVDPYDLDVEEHLPQQAMQLIMQALDDFWPAICIGFNNTRFDDEFLRRGFFATLQNSYVMPGAGSLRADLITIAKANSSHCASQIRPMRSASRHVRYGIGRTSSVTPNRVWSGRGTRKRK